MRPKSPAKMVNPANENPRLRPFGHRLGNLFQIGDTPLRAIAYQ
jgi:hypothetical protein